MGIAKARGRILHYLGGRDGRDSVSSRSIVTAEGQGGKASVATGSTFAKSNEEPTWVRTEASGCDRSLTTTEMGAWRRRRLDVGLAKIGEEWPLNDTFPGQQGTPVRVGICRGGPLHGAGGSLAAPPRALGGGQAGRPRVIPPLDAYEVTVQ